jgi:hypothetical protein
MPVMSDDWRLTLDLGEGGPVEELVEDIRARELQHDAGADLGERAAVTHDGHRVYLYTDAAEAAARAQALLQPLLSQPRYHAQVSLHRWHPTEERWEPADVPLPQTPEEEEAERARREEEEREESREQGYPEWEVRLTLPNHAQTRELAERLTSEGVPVVKLWRHLLVGAETEDDARALAERLRTEAPPDTRFEVEANGQEVWRETHPLTVFGGIAN